MAQNNVPNQVKEEHTSLHETVKDFGMANFRSFDATGAVLEDISKVNLLVGKNNSGKSNVLRFIEHLSRSFGFASPLPNNSQVENLRKKHELSIEDYHLNIGGGFVQSEPEFSFSVLVSTIKPFYEELGEGFLGSNVLTMKGSAITLVYKEVETPFVDSKTLLEMQDKHTSARDELLIKEIKERIYNESVRLLAESLKRIVILPAFREIINSTEQPARSQNLVNGQHVIKDLNKLKNPKVDNSEDLETFSYIERIISQLLNTEVQLEIPYTVDHLILRIENKRLRLDSFGTGIHELVIFCSAIAMYEDAVFLIEEPELHLHPVLQRRFMEFIKERPNTFFITTHSNVLIDEDDNISVFYVADDQGSTRITKVRTRPEAFHLLDDLGYKASDLLQSNFIVWVEGPSDRVYLKKWITDMSEGELKEGIHYSFLMYGGRNLAHLGISLDDEGLDDFIDLLKTSRYSIVICDSDKKRESDELKATVKKLKEKIEVPNITDQSGINQYVGVWVTDGREIENYIPYELLYDVLASDEIRQQYLRRDDGEKVNLEIVSPFHEFSDYDSFDEYFSDLYRSDDGTDLKDDERKRIAKNIAAKKVEIARKIAERWGEDHYSDTLRKQIEKVVADINRANLNDSPVNHAEA